MDNFYKIMDDEIAGAVTRLNMTDEKDILAYQKMPAGEMHIDVGGHRFYVVPAPKSTDLYYAFANGRNGRELVRVYNSRIGMGRDPLEHESAENYSDVREIPVTYVEIDQNKLRLSRMKELFDEAIMKINMAPVSAGKHDFDGEAPGSVVIDSTIFSPDPLNPARYLAHVPDKSTRTGMRLAYMYNERTGIVTENDKDGELLYRTDRFNPDALRRGV